MDDQSNLAVGGLWLHSRPYVVPTARYYFDGWVMDQNIFQHGKIQGDLREAYTKFSIGRFDFALGRQIIVWGKADALNPTDNISPRNYRLLVADDSDQRTGDLAAKLALNAGHLRVMGLWVPEFRPTTLPIPPPPAGVTLGEQSPSQSESLKEYAVKIEESGERVDWSASYFNGVDRIPDLFLDGVSPGGLEVDLHYSGIQTFGMDAAASLGRLGLRGEAAYNLTQYPNEPQAKHSFFYGVVGGDTDLSENCNVNLQYVYRHIYDYVDPTLLPDPTASALATYEALLTNQLDRDQNGISARLVTKWINDALQVEVSGLIWMLHKDYVVRPKLIYAVTDRVKFIAGADYFQGPQLSYLGNLRGLTTAYTELRWYF